MLKIEKLELLGFAYQPITQRSFKPGILFYLIYQKFPFRILYIAFYQYDVFATINLNRLRI